MFLQTFSHHDSKNNTEKLINRIAQFLLERKIMNENGKANSRSLKG